MDYMRKQERWQPSRNMLGVMALGLSSPILIAPALLIILNASRLGLWWLPLLLLYLLPFTTGQIFLVRRLERNRIRGVVGDEAYYTLYPEERKKALKRVRKAGVPPRVAETVALYSDRVNGALSTDDRERRVQLKQEQKKQLALDLFELGVIDAVELKLRMEGK